MSYKKIYEALKAYPRTIFDVDPPAYTRSLDVRSNVLASAEPFSLTTEHRDSLQLWPSIPEDRSWSSKPPARDV